MLLLSIVLGLLCARPASAQYPIGPNNGWKAYLEKAINEHKALEDDTAIADYDMSIKLNPTRPRTYMLRGDCLLDLGKFNDAKADYQKGYDLALHEKYDVFILQEIAVRYANRIDDKKEALAVMQKAYKICKDPRLLFNIAEAEFKNGEYTLASEHFSKSLSELKDAKNHFSIQDEVHLRNMWAQCLMKTKRYAEARQQLTEAIEGWKRSGKSFMSGRNFALYDLRAECNTELHDTKLAAQDKKTADSFRNDLFDVMPFRTK